MFNLKKNQILLLNYIKIYKRNYSLSKNNYELSFEKEEVSLVNKKKKNIYKKSIFYEELSDKNNIENNINILKIIKNSKIENFSIYDSTLILNYLIKNKKNKEFSNELKNINKVKLSSTLYKDAISKVLKNILEYNPKHIYFFFNKFSDLRDLNSIEIIFLHIFNNHLLYFSLYYLTEITYNIAILNCNFKKAGPILNEFLDYIVLTTIKENKNIKNFEKKITNIITTKGINDKKAIYIKSFKNRIRIKGNNDVSNNIIIHDSKREEMHNQEKTKSNKKKSKFSIDSLSNVMLYKLIYSLAKINHNKDLIKELFVLLIPYIRYIIQNKNYVYSKDRNDILVKIIWSFSFLHIRDINLFVDFSLCIQIIIHELSLKYLKILRNIYENLLIFDELLLDKLEDRINQIEKDSPPSHSQPRKKQFKKKKKRIEITDEIKFKLKK
ncbi:conserved Plasmodium protein, unknown function [Plasmodium gallinaceum]|uniref:Uncharacterized protein n=1 Tax=Plasmodium gallinaceum TaxID=5849 RepID=A0A1J1GLP0_PLAGA|nr:conserved Plasmodium protein, unknown function [Plasmodium gallinaceum]CRG93326.1 conserved Plasmodium protein, unknown function [Plasmodium gallinaceum]